MGKVERGGDELRVWMGKVGGDGVSCGCREEGKVSREDE